MRFFDPNGLAFEFVPWRKPLVLITLEVHGAAWLVVSKQVRFKVKVHYS
jgi:hypothetical protein